MSVPYRSENITPTFATGIAEETTSAPKSSWLSMNDEKISHTRIGLMIKRNADIIHNLGVPTTSLRGMFAI